LNQSKFANLEAVNTQKLGEQSIIKWSS